MKNSENPYRHTPKFVLVMVAIAASVYSLSGQLAKVQDAMGGTGASPLAALRGELPKVKGGVSGDPSAQAVDMARELAGMKSGSKPASATLTMFPSDPKMTPEQRAKLLADAERMRPEVPETPRRR